LLPTNRRLYATEQRRAPLTIASRRFGLHGICFKRQSVRGHRGQAAREEQDKAQRGYAEIEGLLGRL